MTYSKILVPFDGSKYSKKALEHAVGLAQNNGIIYLCTIVTAGNVVPPGSLLGMMRDVSHGTLQKRLLSAAITDANKMQAQQMKYCKSKGVRAYQKIIVDGNIAQEILGVAKKKQVDLVVIGSQGLHGIAKLKTLGSVSRKVSEHARCPVLIVR